MTKTMKTSLGIGFWEEDEDSEPSESSRPRIELDWEEDPLSPNTLRDIRDFFGDTQEAFADRMGASLRSVKAWERRKRDSEARNCSGPARKFILHLVRERLET